MRKITELTANKFFNQENFNQKASNIEIKTTETTTIFKLYATTIAILTDNFSEISLVIHYGQYPTSTTLEKIRGILATMQEFYSLDNTYTIRTIKGTIFLIVTNKETEEETKTEFNNKLTINLTIETIK